MQYQRTAPGRSARRLVHWRRGGDRAERPAGALSKFNQSPATTTSPSLRDLALIRATSMEFDAIPPQQVVARLQPMTRPGSPWFGSAGELTAMALVKQGKKNEAGRLFAAIAADRQVPDSIRARAVQIAGSLGVDASASMPTTPPAAQ